MVIEEYKKVFDDLLNTYVILGDSAGPIVRIIKKTPNSDIRSKLVRELRNLKTTRLSLLDQMDELAKPT
jgi:hypothetical protein